MIEVTSEVDIYELDTEKERTNIEEKIVVVSHWNRKEMVCINVGGHCYVVNARDLLCAIENAKNSNR